MISTSKLATPAAICDSSALRCRYKEHVFKASFEPGLVPKAVLALETSLKQSPGSVGTDVPLVTVNTQAQGEVPARFGSGGPPCTVEAMREPLNTLLCARDRELGKSMHRVNV